MLQLFNVRKSYTTGDFTQVALDDVSIAFRKNEFVAVLGASGSGKTTLLNIIGGLDRYDEGDLVVEDLSTTNYRDRDWDTYRNNRVGFVFQSYNLIPHQSVLANVELALTLSGVSRAQRRRRAVEALAQVGLVEHRDKKPSQLSGGQMQRVAIARALINDPEILLADEPTGALDSVTSIQIMALLTEIASDRLVIMVTHNAEIAKQYATRTVRLADGVVAGDTDPYLPEPGDAAVEEPVRRTRMGFLTALGLSFTNLMTKRGRTLMTAFAGSIGIVGIAAILALASGVNDYIRTVEEDTLSVYPLTIQSQGVDLSMLLEASQDLAGEALNPDAERAGSVGEIQVFSRMLSAVEANDLAALKDYFEDEHAIAGDVSSVHYSYDVTPNLFNANPDGTYDQVNPATGGAIAMPFPGAPGGSGSMSGGMEPTTFSELMDDTGVVESQYDVRAGRWPSAEDELMLVLTPSGDLSDFTLYAMGLRDRTERDAMMRALAAGESPPAESEAKTFTYDQLMAVTFPLVDASDYYVYDEAYQVWVDKRGDTGFLNDLASAAPQLRIVGVMQPRSGASATALQPGIFYTTDLTKRVVTHAAAAPIVKSQLADKRIDVFTGKPFTDEPAGLSRDDFDMSSLISIDEDAIAEAFSVDTSKLGIGPSAFDISMPSIQFPDVSFDPSQLPPLDLGAIVAGLELDTRPDEVAAAAEDLVQGYLDYITDGELDPADIETNLPAFLASDPGQEIIAGMEALVEDAQTQLSEQVADALAGYLSTAMATFMDTAVSQVSSSLQRQITGALTTEISSAMQVATAQLAANLPLAMSIDEGAIADAFSFNLDQDELTEIVMAMVMKEESTAAANLSGLGYADLDRPASIDIFPKNFDSKANILTVLDAYNDRMLADGHEDKVITYTDIVGTLMSSVTDILNVITYVLIAFVAISLVVSSIMIGVITFISVLERRKEIGILRSIGASKRDIRWVFNAETLIVGLVAGVLGIATTLLLTVPANAIVSARFDIDQVARLPWQAGVILIGISMVLTFLAGLIPSSAAARRDPVEALRSD